MFSFLGGASRKIARNLIQVTGLGESLAFFQSHNFTNIGQAEVLKLLIAVDACNLLETMQENFIAREISEEDLQDTVDDYVVENLKAQPLFTCRDGAERMDQCQEILALAAKFQENWTREDTKDPGPRFYCVKDLLRRLGCEDNAPIHDNLFEFVYQQHNRFIRYFRTLLEPFREESSTEPTPEPQPLAVSIHSPAERTLDPALETVYPEGKEPLSESFPETEREERRGEKEEIYLAPPPQAPAEPVREAAPALELNWETGETVLMEKDRAISEGARSGEELATGPALGPTPQMVEELFRRVNPIDEDHS